VTSSRTAEFVRRLAAPDPAVVAQVDNPDEITSRILAAALEQAELVGMRRTTMEDVARRSGVGRATLYRRFPTKAALIDAVVLAEVRRFLDGDALARSRGTTFEDRMVYGTVFTVTFLREHALLKKLLRTEPETIHRAISSVAARRALRRCDHNARPGAPPTHRRRIADPPHAVLHRHPPHQHQSRHHRRRARIRAHLPPADDHRTRLTRGFVR
jgi:AcrR family transcriptional regulator